MGKKVCVQSSQRYLPCCFSKVLLSTSVIAQIYHTYSRLIWICSFLCSFCSQRKSGRRAVLKYYILGFFEVCWLTLLPAVPFFNCLFHFRLLLQLIQLQQSSFALENNIKGQKEIDDKVARLGFNENSLLLVTKVRGCFIVCKFSAIHRLVEVPEPVQAQSPVSDTPLS